MRNRMQAVWAVCFATLTASARADIVAVGTGPGYSTPGGNFPTLIHYSTSGQYLGQFAGVFSEELSSLTRGPDGGIYVISNILGGGAILRVDPVTRETQTVYSVPQSPPWPLYSPLGLGFDSQFRLHAGANFDPQPGAPFRRPAIVRVQSGTLLDLPPVFPTSTLIRDLEFDAQSNLYVAMSTGITRYTGTTANALYTIPGFAPDFEFGPDGKLYKATDAAGILRYDPADGSLLGTFVPPGSGGLQNVRDLLFAPDGYLYVNSTTAKKILKYDASTGAFAGTYVDYAILGNGAATGSIAFVPEPATGVLLACALALPALVRRTRR